MNKNIILGGVSFALFAAGLIFFANSGASNAVATETELNPKERPAACRQLVKDGSCGCTANGGSCSCGQNGGSTCQQAAAGVTNSETKAGSKSSCGCKKAAQAAAESAK